MIGVNAGKRKMSNRRSFKGGEEEEEGEDLAKQRERRRRSMKSKTSDFQTSFPWREEATRRTYY